MIYRRMFGTPSWSFRTPFEELDQIRRRMLQLADTFYEGSAERPDAGVFPPINLSEDRDNYYVRAELPGVAGEEIDLQATANSLSLAGKRTIDVEDEGVRYHRREREGGSFSRMITLPGEIDSDRIEARMASGILTVVVPKAEAAKPRQITVG